MPEFYQTVKITVTLYTWVLYLSLVHLQCVESLRQTPLWVRGAHSAHTIVHIGYVPQPGPHPVCGASEEDSTSGLEMYIVHIQ
jgi:hypothetical protein